MGRGSRPYDAYPTAPPRPPSRWVSWLVPVFLVANVAAFVATMYVNDCPKNARVPSMCVWRKELGRFAFQPLRENPLFGPSTATLLKMGGLDVNKVVHDHQQWRLISSIWLHGGVVHLLANMLSLLFIGIGLEQEFGFLRIGPLYIISGIGGSVLSALFIKSSISVGASGALFGLLGSMLSELITNWTVYANKCSALMSLVFIIAINLAIGILPRVDNFAHVGGFISGFLLGFVLLMRPQFGYVSRNNAPIGYPIYTSRRKHKIYQYVLWIVGAILLVVGFAVGLTMLFRGENGYEHCSWCHYLSCVPTRFWSCNQQQSSSTCTTSQLGNNWNLTCSGSGMTQSYVLQNATEYRIYELCTDLCS